MRQIAFPIPATRRVNSRLPRLGSVLPGDNAGPIVGANPAGPSSRCPVDFRNFRNPCLTHGVGSAGEPAGFRDAGASNGLRNFRKPLSRTGLRRSRGRPEGASGTCANYLRKSPQSPQALVFAAQSNSRKSSHNNTSARHLGRRGPDGRSCPLQLPRRSPEANPSGPLPERGRFR